MTSPTIDSTLDSGDPSENEPREARRTVWARRFREQRRALVAASATLLGLDRAEARRTSELDWVLTLHFLTGAKKNEPIPPGLSPLHLRLLAEAESRFEAPEVLALEVRPEHAAADVLLRFRDRRQALLAERSSSDFLVAITGVPSIDRFFHQASFRFGPPVAETEPLVDTPPPEETAASHVVSESAPPVDYLARDYDSFRRLMLDTLGARVRGWAERNPADLGVTLVEILAYAGDYLSYFQDAVATEAYLQTARLRTSVRRHGRLVDFFLGEGANARTWVQLELSDGDPVPLPRGTQVLTESGDLPPTVAESSWQHDQALGGGAVIFETMFDAVLRPELGRLELYNWGTTEHTLLAGATTAALRGHVTSLEQGDLLLLEELEQGEAPSRETATRAHVVRLSAPPVLGTDPATGSAYTSVRWYEADALPFPVVVSRRGADGASERRARASGNLVLADHGQTVVEMLPPVEAAVAYRPTLERLNLTFRSVPDPAALADKPAAIALAQDPRAALPAISLVELDPDCTLAGSLQLRPGATWFPRRDLLAADRFAREFVVEMSEERQAHLRFGDGRHGRLPIPGARFEAYYRVGGGPSGNIGAGTLRHLVGDQPRITAVRNPLAALGGRGWERIEKARVTAPTAFHSQQRCVTPEDFVATALLHPDVLTARARLRWTGTWNTAFVFVQRRGGRPLTSRFRAELERIYAGRLVADLDLELRPPRWVALAVGLRVGVALHQDPGVVRNRLEDVLSDRLLPNGQMGFFYPDAHGFGERIYAADLIARASAVSGVVSVVIETFARRGEPSRLALQRGYLELAPLEIALCRNQPAMPQLGVLELTMEAAR